MIDLILMTLGAALVGAWLAWMRPDLDIAPGEIARRSFLLAIAASVFLFPMGVRGEPLLLIAGLIPLALIDLRRALLPNEGTLALIALGLLFGVVQGADEALARALGAALGYGALRALGAAWLRWRGVEALGLGDVKLLAAIGAFLGWRVLPEVALIAALAGIAAALVLRLRRDAHLPFGPALAFGALISIGFRYAQIAP